MSIQVSIHNNLKSASIRTDVINARPYASIKLEFEATVFGAGSVNADTVTMFFDDVAMATRIATSINDAISARATPVAEAAE